MPIVLPTLCAIYLDCRPVERGMTTVRASELTYEIAPEGSRDYAPILGILGLAAYQ